MFELTTEELKEYNKKKNTIKEFCETFGPNPGGTFIGR